jgi:uncharacterized protein (TIGR03435 family)
VLKKLLMEAYGVERYQVEGPSWIEHEMFDVMAAKPQGTTPGLERQMLQNLLAARFHVTQHTEKRELPAFVLLPGKDTAKLHPVKDSEGAECRSSGTMGQLAGVLATQIDKPVVDQTGIPGRYYFVLRWSDAITVRTDGPSGAAPPPSPPPPASSGPCPGWTGPWPPFEANIFDAVREQMGLRLERRGTASVNVIVLDRAERPGAN